MRLIDADGLLKDTRDISEYAPGCNWFVVGVEDIENAPTIEAEPVVHACTTGSASMVGAFSISSTPTTNQLHPGAYSLISRVSFNNPSASISLIGYPPFVLFNLSFKTGDSYVLVLQLIKIC